MEIDVDSSLQVECNRWIQLPIAEFDQQHIAKIKSELRHEEKHFAMLKRDKNKPAIVHQLWKEVGPFLFVPKFYGLNICKQRNWKVKNAIQPLQSSVSHMFGKMDLQLDPALNQIHAVDAVKRDLMSYGSALLGTPPGIGTQ